MGDPINEKTGYVFGNGNGGHIGDIKHSFTSACRKAGITDFRFHDLRHPYASHLAMRGVHIRALQELLGPQDLDHDPAAMPIAPEQLQNAVKLLDGVIGFSVACKLLIFNGAKIIGIGHLDFFDRFSR